MNRSAYFVFIFLFVCGLFVAAFNPVSAELVENTWNSKTSMSQARADLGVVAVEGKIYAIGGYARGNQTGFVGTNECYDPNTDTWVTLEPMPTPRSAFAITTHQGKIYCIGGAVLDERGGSITFDVTEVYDTYTDSWSTKASSPFSGGYLQAHIVDGKLFVLHGNNLYMYDPVGDVWTAKNSMPADWPSYSSSVIVNGKIIVFYKFESTANLIYTGYQKTLIYDSETDTWSERKAAPMNIYFSIAEATTGLYAPQRIYVLGETRTDVYDLFSDTWSTAKGMPTQRKNFGVTVVDDVLYVLGGLIVDYSSRGDDLLPYDIEYLSLTESYVPIGYQGDTSSTADTSKPTPTESISPSESSTPTEPSEPFLTYLIVTLITIPIGTIIVGLLFSKKGSKNKSAINS